jgi:putrescine aminotransferase
MSNNFAFLVHPLGNKTDRVLSYLHESDLRGSFDRGMTHFFHDLHVAMARSQSPGDPGVSVIDEFPGLVSATGARAEGRLYEIPMTSRAILAEPKRALDAMLVAAADAAAWGAGIIGLGAMTGVVGGHGQHLATHAGVPVTTGNSLTVYAAIANLLHLCSDLEIDVAAETICVIGVPGSIATAAARLLRPRCRELVLVARQDSPRSRQIAAELDAALRFDVQEALQQSRLVFSATSSGGCVDQRWLQPGTILSDVGVPTDTIGVRSLRRDALILSGGLCEVPATMPRTSRYLWFHRGSMAACLAETVVLALDGAPVSLSIGRDLSTAAIESIGRRAEAHGFRFSRPFSFGQALDDSTLVAYRKARAGGKAFAQSAAARSAAELGAKARARFRRYLNPAMEAVGGDLLRPFVRGEGVRVWDEKGRSYLDFVAGYGALNLGHNHPAVAAAVDAALRDRAPGFSPAAINPWAAALAEELVGVAPAGLEMVFFANSGTEAVEAGIKLARRASGRPGVLHCRGAFHGKTLGSLSLSGNPDYQRPFAPLVPEVEAVPYGDVEALAAALQTRRFGAFVVEPVQGEGGIHVPPPEYLPRARQLCDGTGTLLVVDEVQTGLGRTGTLFAVDRHGVAPDVMVLAKSLSGGLVPIGAMLTRRDLWRDAYGTLDTFALHTNTFGGGSLACAAGLATLRALQDGEIVANAAARGDQIASALRRMAARTPLLREARGQGLLLGLEFEPPPAAVSGVWSELIVGDMRPYLTPGVARTFDSLSAIHVMALLLEEHHIHAQVTRSNPRVLRIEPPLIVTAADAQAFIDALELCIDEVATAFSTFEQLIAKAIRGEHGEGPGPAGELQ